MSAQVLYHPQWGLGWHWQRRWPTWLAAIWSPCRSAPDQLFLAAVYALLIVAPLAHMDGAIIHRLFGNPMARQLRIVGEREPSSLFPEWL